MSKGIEDLEERANEIRKSESVARWMGTFAVGAAGLCGILAVTYNVTTPTEALPVLAGVEVGSLVLATQSIMRSLSEGRRADVIDAEILRRKSSAGKPD